MMLWRPDPCYMVDSACRYLSPAEKRHHGFECGVSMEVVALAGCSDNTLHCVLVCKLVAIAFPFEGQRQNLLQYDDLHAKCLPSQTSLRAIEVLLVSSELQCEDKLIHIADLVLLHNHSQESLACFQLLHRQSR